MTNLFAASEKKSLAVRSRNSKSGVSGMSKPAPDISKKEVDGRKQSWVDKAIAVNKRLGHEATQGLLDKLYSISGDKVNYDRALKEMPEIGSGFVNLVLSTQKILFPLEKERKEWDGILGNKTIKRGEEVLVKDLHFSTLWNALADFLSDIDDTVSGWWDSFVEWASSRSEADQKNSGKENTTNTQNGGVNDISQAGLEFIAGHEGFRSQLYNDVAGHCTIGYGHLVHKGNCTETEEAGLKNGIDRQRGLEILHQDASVAVSAVNNLVRVPLSQNRFDALVSFVFNVGTGNFSNSTLLKVLNQGNYNEVANQLNRWIKAGRKPVKGLMNRRAAEAHLFDHGSYES